MKKFVLTTLSVLMASSFAIANEAENLSCIQSVGKVACIKKYSSDGAGATCKVSYRAITKEGDVGVGEISGTGFKGFESNAETLFLTLITFGVSDYVGEKIEGTIAKNEAMAELSQNLDVLKSVPACEGFVNANAQ